MSPTRRATPEFFYTPGASCPLGRISWSGFNRDPRGQMTGPMRPYGTYALVYLLDGSGEYRDAKGRRSRVRAGDLILTFPEIPRQYGGRIGSSWHEFYIIFDGPVFDLWRRQGLLDEARPVRTLQPIHYWSRRLEQTVRSASQGERSALTEVCTLQDVLAEILELERRAAVHGANRKWLAEAYAILDNMDVSRSPDYGPLTKALGLTYAGFRSRFTRLSGISPGRYLAQVQLRHACRLMESGDLKLRQIAERCGYSDEFHLSRRFKQLMGLTPREFRRRLPRPMPPPDDE